MTFKRSEISLAAEQNVNAHGGMTWDPAAQADYLAEKLGGPARGKAQLAIIQKLRGYTLGMVSKGHKFDFNDLVKEPEFRGIHYGKLAKAAEALAKKGRVAYDGKTITLTEDIAEEAVPKQTMMQFLSRGSRTGQLTEMVAQDQPLLEIEDAFAHAAIIELEGGESIGLYELCEHIGSELTEAQERAGDSVNLVEVGRLFLPLLTEDRLDEGKARKIAGAIGRGLAWAAKKGSAAWKSETGKKVRAKGKELAGRGLKALGKAAVGAAKAVVRAAASSETLTKSRKVSDVPADLAAAGEAVKKKASKTVFSKEWWTKDRSTGLGKKVAKWAGATSKDRAEVSKLAKSLAKRKAAGEKIKDPEALARWIGAKMGGHAEDQRPSASLLREAKIGPSYTPAQLLKFLKGQKPGTYTTVNELQYSFGGTASSHTAVLKTLVKAGKLKVLPGKTMGRGSMYGLAEGAVVEARSAWSYIKPQYRSKNVGWTKSGEFACPYCGVSIGKNLRGDKPFANASAHLKKAHGKTPADMAKLTEAADPEAADNLKIANKFKGKMLKPTGELGNIGRGPKKKLVKAGNNVIYHDYVREGSGPGKKSGFTISASYFHVQGLLRKGFPVKGLGPDERGLPKWFVYEFARMAEEVQMGASAALLRESKSPNAKVLLKQYLSNEDDNYHSENYLLLAKAYGTPVQVKKVQAILKRNRAQGHTSKADNDWMYKNINPYYRKLVAAAKGRAENVQVSASLLREDGGVTGGYNRYQKLMPDDTRDKIMQARAQEIEAFAADRGYDLRIVMAIAEVSMRMGRVPDLRQYGVYGEEALAIRHFIAGDILNLAIEDEQPSASILSEAKKLGKIPKKWQTKTGKKEIELGIRLAQQGLISSTDPKEIRWAQKLYAFAHDAKGSGVPWWEKAEKAEKVLKTWLKKHGHSVPKMVNSAWVTEAVYNISATPAASKAGTDVHKMAQQIATAIAPFLKGRYQTVQAQDVFGQAQSIHIRSGNITPAMAGHNVAWHNDDYKFQAIVSGFNKDGSAGPKISVEQLSGSYKTKKMRKKTVKPGKESLMVNHIKKYVAGLMKDAPAPRAEDVSVSVLRGKEPKPALDEAEELTEAAAGKATIKGKVTFTYSGGGQPTIVMMLDGIHLAAPRGWALDPALDTWKNLVAKHKSLKTVAQGKSKTVNTTVEFYKSSGDYKIRVYVGGVLLLDYYIDPASGLWKKLVKKYPRLLVVTENEEVQAARALPGFTNLLGSKKLDVLHEVAAPGFSGTVKAMKGEGGTKKKAHKGEPSSPDEPKDIDNPWALSWHMWGKGNKSHYDPEKGKSRYKSPEKYAADKKKAEEVDGNLRAATRFAELLGCRLAQTQAPTKYTL